MGNLSEMVLNTLSELSKTTYASKKEILSTVVHILHYGGKGFDEESIYFTTNGGDSVYRIDVGEKSAAPLK